MTSDILKEDIKEQNEFIREGFTRIKKYYTLPLDKRESETGLSTSPHEMLLEKAAIVIDLGLYSIFDYKDVDERYQGTAETLWSAFGTGVIGFDYILIGVGTEILLKAILLKEQPDFFIKKTRYNRRKDTYHTLDFDKCEGWLIAFLRSKISPTHWERVKDVLELIQLKRNNLAHLGFHRESNYREDYQVANVLRFLFLYFFKANSSKIVIKLDKVKEETKVTSGIDYEPVEFDFYIN